MSSSTKVKASELLGKNKADLTKQLNELKEELLQLRVQKVSGSNSSKLTRITNVRKGIARVLTVIHAKTRQAVRDQKKKRLPLDLRPKKTRAIRRRLTKVTERERKRRSNFPTRLWSVKA